jgi:hypothetical protein
MSRRNFDVVSRDESDADANSEKRATFSRSVTFVQLHRCYDSYCVQNKKRMEGEKSAKEDSDTGN